MVAYIFVPSTWEAEASIFLRVQSQLGLQRKFQRARANTENLCQKKCMCTITDSFFF